MTALSPKKWVFPEKSINNLAGENEGEKSQKKQVRGKLLYTFVNLENEKKFFACMSDGHKT